MSFTEYVEYNVMQPVELTHAKPLRCKKVVAEESRIITGSECMNRLVTIRSDIRIWPRLSILNT